MNKWIAEFELEDGDTMPEHMDLNYMGARIDFHCRPLEQEPKTDKYEYHTDHTDCIWYGSDSGCPVTCSQYRDGWNDAMNYIYKDGNGYQPYKRNE